ncbi:cupin domain-containing protein [Myxococcota bacterium]|nr:cupin domain-containing protein [Myxococcota bacterium]
MHDRALELLPDYVLGNLSGDELRDVEAALASSAELRAEAAAMAEDFAVLADGLTPVAPSPNVRERLFASVAGEHRYFAFGAALSKYFDLARARVEELIRAIDDAATEWTDGPLPGIRLMHFPGGPATAGADTGFVWFPANLPFPWHRHLGREVNFVMQGSVIDYGGRVYGPGEAIIKEPGTEHEFTIGPEPTLLAVVIHEGFEICPDRRPV